MKRILALLIITLVMLSCTSLDVRRTLNDVESYIMERPDSALTVLESFDSKELKPLRNRAHHALLYAMALDKNYIDVTDDSIAQVAVDFYHKRGPRRNYARALYYLGKSYYYQEEYDKAILECTKAETVAFECDSLYLGMIKTAQAMTYAKTYNSIEELRCIQEAERIFKKIGVQTYARSASLSLGIAYHNADKYAEAYNVFRQLMESSPEIDYFYIRAMLAMPHSMIEMPEVNYYSVDSLFRTAKYTYNANFTERDCWAWAYSLYRIGCKEQADNIVQNISITNELVANFWRLRIASYYGDHSSTERYMILANQQQNDIVESLLEESLATYQRDYYRSQLESSEYKIKVRTLGLMAVVVISLLLLLVIYFVVSRYIRRQREEKEKLLEYAEEIRRQLTEAEMNDSSLKSKYVALYKTRFETIGALTEKYLQSEGRTDIEALMFKKVMSLIDEVKKDSLNREKFEAMLDEDLDMVMTRLRSEMPKFSELDYSIFSYVIVGFDATTISRLLDVSVNNIYAHKRRIRIRIEKRQPEHASQFLEMLA